MRFSISLTLLAGLLPLAAGASWEDVIALRKGARIGVIQSGLRRTDGVFDSATASTLTIIDNGATRSLSRDQVVRVYKRPRLNRVTRIALGAGIGVAAGAALDASVGRRFRNEGNDVSAALYGASIGVGAGFGALSGGGYQTVYQAAPGGIKSN